jgi:hypothetical protein
MNTDLFYPLFSDLYLRCPVVLYLFLLIALNFAFDDIYTYGDHITKK